MTVKANLHMHTAEDLKERFKVKYTIYQAIDKARSYGFGALALTCHKRYVYSQDYFDYARNKGILLISGIELGLRNRILGRKDIIVLNCDKSAERIKTLDDLAGYKRSHPEIFVIAPHPNFSRWQSVGLAHLLKYIDLFDAIEYSWFYSRSVNFNLAAEEVAKRYGKPFIATSDTHDLKYLNASYALIEAEEPSPAAIFRAIKRKRFTNVAAPQKISELTLFSAKMVVAGLTRGRRR